MENIETDFLIIGSGIAGLSAGIKLSQLGTVALVSKKEFLEGSTHYAQGGIAAVMSPQDSFEQHVQDTLRAGAGLCRESVVRGIVEEGPECIRELVQWGMEFTRDSQDEDATYELALEGGHTQRRVLHAGDFTGSEIARTLLQKARSTPNIQFFDYHVAIDLITTEKMGAPGPNRCLGAYILSAKTNSVQPFLARRATIR